MSERDGLKIIDQLPLDFDRKACPSKGGAPFFVLLRWLLSRPHWARFCDPRARLMVPLAHNHPQSTNHKFEFFHHGNRSLPAPERARRRPSHWPTSSRVRSFPRILRQALEHRDRHVLILGIPFLQGMQYIAVVNGKLSTYGDGALAVVMASGLVEAFSTSR